MSATPFKVEQHDIDPCGFHVFVIDKELDPVDISDLTLQVRYDEANDIRHHVATELQFQAANLIEAKLPDWVLRAHSMIDPFERVREDPVTNEQILEVGSSFYFLNKADASLFKLTYCNC